ncbi:MAG: thioesterase family protein [Dehalococcoidales bacterium]|nr:thioesterase family protein [Dehalococcoidales bacterium]
MPRKTITLPNEFIFSTEIPIRIGDINRRNHLSNTAYLVIAEEARKRFFTSLGFTDNGTPGYIITDTTIIYMNQAYYGQVLKVEVGAGSMTEKALSLVYRISDTETGLEFARVESGMLFYDYREKKVVVIPENVKAKLS